MKEGRSMEKIEKEKGDEAREGTSSKKSALERRQGWENKKIKAEEIRILSRSKAMERRTRRWEERWGSGEGKAKRGGERQPRGDLWRIVHQLMWDWFSEMTEDWQLKSKPHCALWSRSFHLLSFYFLLSFPRFSSLLGGLFLPFPSPLLSSLVTQHCICA